MKSIKDASEFEFDDKHKLLVVENEDDLQKILIEIIQSVGIPCVGAYNGTQALELLAQDNFTAILCDIYMPRMDGLQLMLELRRKFIAIPVVIMTGNSSLEVAKAALRLGATDYLEKPVQTEEVKTVAKRIMEIGIRLQKIHNNELGIEKLTPLQLEQEMMAINLLRLKNGGV